MRALALLALVAGCSRAPSGDVRLAPLRVGVFVPITEPTPFTDDGLGATVQELVFRSLVGEDERGATQPDLAESIEWIAQGRSLRLRLREGQRFADGAPVTAKEVVATYRRARAQGVWGMDQILDEVAESDGVILLRVAHPYVLPAGLLTGAARESGGGLVGSGPYRVESRDERRLVLRQSPTYTAEPDRPEVIEFLRFDSSAEPLSRLLAREIDLVPSVPWSRHALFRTIQSVRAAPVLSRTVYVIHLPATAPFDRPEARLALALAIDREALAGGPFRGQAEPARGVVWPGAEDFDAGTSPYPYDPARALALLAEADVVAGAKGGLHFQGAPFRPVLRYFQGHDELEEIALLVERQLGEIGLSIELRPQTAQEMMAADGPVSLSLTVRHASTDLMRDPEVARAGLPAPSEAASLEERRLQSAALQRALRDDPPSVYLVWPRRLQVMDTAYCGLSRRPDGPEAALHRVHRCAPGEVD